MNNTVQSFTELSEFIEEESCDVEIQNVAVSELEEAQKVIKALRAALSGKTGNDTLFSIEKDLEHFEAECAVQLKRAKQKCEELEVDCFDVDAVFDARQEEMVGA